MGKQRSAIEFDYAPEYARINAEAQRRYNDQVKAPYLTWSFGSWQPTVKATTREERLESRLKWIDDDINGFLRALGVEEDQLFRLEDLNNDQHAIGFDHDNEKSKPLQFVERDVISLNGKLKGLPNLFCRFELHSEYFAVTLIQPIRDPMAPLENLEPLQDQHPMSGGAFCKTGPYDALDELVSDILNTIIRTSDETDETYRNRAAIAWDRLYSQAWDIALEGVSVKAPGKVFSSSRGIVLPRVWLSPAYGVDEYEAHQRAWKKDSRDERFVDTDLDGRPTVIEPKSHPADEHEDWPPESPLPPNPRRWNRVSGGRALENNAALRHAMHWPGGRLPSADNAKALLRRRTVANLVLDGRALFASTFGAGLPIRGGNDLGLEPVETSGRFALFYCREYQPQAITALERRLDRVVQRLHSLALRRAMGMKDLDNLWRANYRLGEIDRDIQDALRAATDRDKKGRTNKRWGRSASPKIARKLAEVQFSFSYGLDNRVNRARYYAQDFNDTLGDLSLDRVEGWEPYDEFARRRLMPQWRNISNIGERADATRARLDRLVDIENGFQVERLTFGAIRLGSFAISLNIFLAVALFGFTHFASLLSVLDGIGPGELLFFAGGAIVAAFIAAAFSALISVQIYHWIRDFALRSQKD